MLVVTLNKDKYKYDIHSLFKAFYPEQDVKMILKDEESSLRSDEGMPSAVIDMEETEGYIEMQLVSADGTVKTERAVCAEEGTGNETANPDYATNGSTASLLTPKNALKQLIYGMLSLETGMQLPWGTLTGIRPVKIPMMMLEQGCQPEEIHDYMQKVFFTS